MAYIKNEITESGKRSPEVYTSAELQLLNSCSVCPRECGVNRFSPRLGYCRSGADFDISSICIHKGEEPVLSGQKGVCNVFFPHCNLQCLYCQNHDISRNSGPLLKGDLSYEEIIERICNILDRTENVLGFVSPSHYIPQMMAIIRGVHRAGKHPVIVYNSNGYDKPGTLQMLEGLVDVYLPDFKYIDPALAFEYSHAGDYPEVAAAALKEMYRQKGSTLIVNDRGIAESGIIVRHLILPGNTDQSIKVLHYIAEEVSVKLHISLMAQYYPTAEVTGHSLLGRTITSGEYDKVVEAFHHLGFYRGWIQELESFRTYRPDFNRDQPFCED